MTTRGRTCALSVAMSVSLSGAVVPQSRRPADKPNSPSTRETTMTHVAEAPRSAAAPTSIRQFRVDIPEAALVDLKRRIAATRWPERETVTDFSQGVQLARLKPLVEYWGTKH